MEEQVQNQMTYQDFWRDTIAECQADIEDSNNYPTTIFYDKFEDELIENNVFCALDFHYYETKGNSRKYPSMHIDYGKVDESDNSINLMAIDYDPSQITTITKEKQTTIFDKLFNFILNIVHGYFIEFNLQADPIYNFVKDIASHLETTDTLNLFILSSNVKYSGLKAMEDREVHLGTRDILVKYQVIDIDYLYKSSLSGKHLDPVNIKVAEINNGKITGINCLASNSSDGQYQAFLAALPGDFLSEIYRLYGGRLLEKNVRSFLSTRGSINKGIRNTIRTEPEKFFTYNNGIACTASSVKTERREDGLYITEIDDLQIINGGQTTASLRNAVLTDKDHVVDLTKVFVPMKLTVLSDSLPEDDKEILIGNISKYANSQNKVSNSDLNSNSPFYVQLEKLSRNTYTPTMVNGISTRWYFERSRGQYERDQMELTEAKRKKFKEVNPKSQLIKIVDIAKFYNSVVERPFKVVWGGQVNAEDFQKAMQSAYDSNKDFVNLNFYKTLVAYGIMFIRTKELVRKTESYQNHMGLLALIVPYTVSMFVHLVNNAKKRIDWIEIWKNQKMPDCFETELERLGIWVIDVITDPKREKDNVGEWTKLTKCWEDMVKRPYTLGPSIFDHLISPEDEKANELSAKKEQKANRMVDYGIYVFKLGAAYWQNVLKAGQTNNKFMGDYESQKYLQDAIESCKKGALLRKQQALNRLMEIKKEFEEEGIVTPCEPLATSDDEEDY